MTGFTRRCLRPPTSSPNGLSFRWSNNSNSSQTRVISPTVKCPLPSLSPRTLSTVGITTHRCPHRHQGVWGVLLQACLPQECQTAGVGATLVSSRRLPKLCQRWTIPTAFHYKSYRDKLLPWSAAVVFTQCCQDQIFSWQYCLEKWPSKMCSEASFCLRPVNFGQVNSEL